MKLLSKFLSALYILTLLSSIAATYINSQVSADTTSSNLIANPSVETASSDSTTPDSWLKGGWGTNTATYTYSTSGYDGTRAVSVGVTQYTSGDAKWYFTPVAVTAGTQYSFSDYYKSDVATDIVAQFDNGTGTYTYQDLGAATSSTSWNNYSASFTVPTGITNVTIFHVIAAIGTLTTDDFSLTPTSTTSTGTTSTSSNLIANESMETVSSSSTLTPDSWLEGSWGTNTPTFSYLTTGHTGSHSIEVSMQNYSSGDAKWYFKPVTVSANTAYTFSDYYESSVATDVVAQLDDGSGNYTYTDLGTAPASTTWKQYTSTITTLSNTASITIFHVIAANGTLTTDDFSLTSAATSTAPTVTLSAPVSNATITGTTTLSANASAQGSNALSKVDFAIDGQVVGSVAKTPYTYNWDSTSVTNGTHTVTAIATAADGQTTTSAATTITVNNAATTSNLIPNPSVETVSSSDSTTPEGWYEGTWGNNTSSFTYATVGHTGSRSVRIDMSNYVDGGANWTYDAQSVVPGQVYEFSDYYQSNVATQVLVAVTMQDGTTQYIWLGNPYTSDGTWSKFFASFTMPSGAVSAIAYQGIDANGYFTADDFDFQPYTPQGFSNPLVSVTFDDGIASQYTAGLPILQKYGLAGTFYVITGDVGVCDPNVSSICYMTQSQVEGLQSANQEVGSHTVTHPDLTTISTSQVTQELSQSQATLNQWIGTSVTDFAAPYGDVNQSVLSISQQYYTSQRGVEAGYNDIDNYNQQDLLVQDVDSDTTVAQVESYIDTAKATNTWLILVYHDINADTSVDEGYDTTPSDFDTEMAYLKNSGVSVQTMAQALQTVSTQVN